MKNRNQSPYAVAAVSYNQFQSRTQQFITVAAQRLNMAQWFEHSRPHHAFLHADMGQYAVTEPEERSTFFVPFVQKMIVPSTAKVIVVADIHGDIQALTAILEHLQSVGSLSPDYKILDPNLYLVFLGDYVNRKPSGVPVMYLLFDLFIKNSDRVVLLRGNHESAGSNKHFRQRHAAQDGSFLYELEQRFEGYRYPDLLAWYDYLPMALYLGSVDSEGVTTYTKLCHGGLEIGYNMADFLADDTALFRKLTTLDRKKALQAFSTSSIAGLAQQIQASQQFAQVQCADYWQSYTSKPTDFSTDPKPWVAQLGMQYNNFVTEDNETVEFALSPTRRNLYLGRALTAHLFNQVSGQKSRMASVIRGHQHLDEEVAELGLNTTMMTRIKAGKGLVHQWNGMVYTLGATSWVSGYQSFVQLQLDARSKNYSLKHFFKAPDSESFSFKITRFLTK